MAKNGKRGDNRSGSNSAGVGRWRNPLPISSWRALSHLFAW